MTVIANKFDIIILSLVKDEDSLYRTKSCIDSYIETAGPIINQILVIETNKDANYIKLILDPKIKIIKPGIEFNYNKFFNIALEQCEAEFIFGPNNDLIIQPNCLQTILREFQTNPEIYSISPIDRNWHRHTKMYLPNDNKLYYGYDVSLHMFGCAFAARRSVFEKIGYLDEQFYFFYQDNDYIECLKQCELKHGVYTSARVIHGSGKSNNIADKKFQYTSENMYIQGEIFKNKWQTKTTWKPFKQYK
jgi:hypothetical protein